MSTYKHSKCLERTRNYLTSFCSIGLSIASIVGIYFLVTYIQSTGVFSPTTIPSEPPTITYLTTSFQPPIIKTTFTLPPPLTTIPLSTRILTTIPLPPTIPPATIPPPTIPPPTIPPPTIPPPTIPPPTIPPPTIPPPTKKPTDPPITDPPPTDPPITDTPNTDPPSNLIEVTTSKRLLRKN
jgi:hypothetical protein